MLIGSQRRVSNQITMTKETYKDVQEPLNEIVQNGCSAQVSSSGSETPEFLLTAKKTLKDAICALLDTCTGIPVSDMTSLLRAHCPGVDLGGPDDGQMFLSTPGMLQQLLCELLCLQKLNLETWFVDEEKAELYVLTFAYVANSDWIRPSRDFGHLQFPTTSEHQNIVVYSKAISVTHFYFSFSSQNDEYEEMVDQMQEFYSSSSGVLRPPLLPTLAPDVLCAVMHRNLWTRGRILSVGASGVEVEPLDECSTLKVKLPTEYLRVLTGEFRSLPPRTIQAYFCSAASTEAATNTRVLLGVHKAWMAYRIDSTKGKTDQDRPDHSFVAHISQGNDENKLSIIVYPVMS